MNIKRFMGHSTTHQLVLIVANMGTKPLTTEEMLASLRSTPPDDQDTPPGELHAPEDCLESLPTTEDTHRI